MLATPKSRTLTPPVESRRRAAIDFMSYHTRKQRTCDSEIANKIATKSPATIVRNRHPLVADECAYLTAIEDSFVAAEDRGYQLHVVPCYSVDIPAMHGKPAKKAKTPNTRGYRHNRISLQGCVDSFYKRESSFGIVPKSVGLVVVDIDRGNPEVWKRKYPPIAALKSFSGRGEHLYYAVGDIPPAIKSTGNRVIIDGEEFIVDVVYQQPFYSFVRHDEWRKIPAIISAVNPPAFPHDAFADLFPETLNPAKPIEAVKMQRNWKTLDYKDLSQVKEGERHQVLVKLCSAGNQVGAKMVKQGKIQSVGGMLELVMKLNLELPEPIDDDNELERIARDCYLYLKNGSRPAGKWFWRHDREHQQDAQAAMVAKRNAESMSMRERVYQLADGGASLRVIEDQTKTPRSTASRWLKARGRLF